MLLTKLKYYLIGGTMLALILAAGWFRLQQLNAELECQEQKTEIAETATDTVVEANKAVERIEIEHRREDREAKESIDKGSRAHFDNNW